MPAEFDTKGNVTMTPGMTRLHIRSPWIFAVLAAILILAGCTALEKEEQHAVHFDEWRARAETSKAHSPSPKARDLLLPAPQLQPPPKEVVKKEPEPVRTLPEKKVTMTMRNTDVNVILRALAQAADQNIMMNDGVKGTTHINVMDTPWDQVFLAVLKTRGLTYTWEGDIIRVLSLEDLRHDKDINEIQQQQKSIAMESKKVEPLLTKVIPLNFYTIDQLSEFTSIESNANSSSSSGSGDQENEDKRRVEELFEKQLTVNDQGMKIGSVTADIQTNSLIVNALRDDLAKIVSLVDELDRPTTQILLEAHIVETTKETARALGIQWGGLYKGSTSANDNHYITGGSNSYGVGGLTTSASSSSAALSMPAMVNLPADLTGMTLGNGFTMGLLAEKVGHYLLNVQLSALEEANKLHILSSPSITTLNNQMAIIESGAEIPFQTVDAGSGNINISFKDAVLRLEVTPHVIDTDQLKLMIIINKDEVDFTKTVLGNPTIIKKTAKTNLILANGATTVIGGLSKETDSRADSGVPWMKDLPGIGHLFKNKKKSNDMEEVLIFITPHILREKTATKMH